MTDADSTGAGELADIARHSARQAQKGKGIRFEARAMDLLNAIGVGELILAKAAEAQRGRRSAGSANWRARECSEGGAR